MLPETNFLKYNFSIYIIFGIFILLFTPCSVLSQAEDSNPEFEGSEDIYADTVETRELTLEETIELARNNSPSALRSATQKENRYWQWRVHKSRFMPQLSLDGTLPDFSREFEEVTQEDGSIEYRPVFNNNSNLDLSLSQRVGATGGSIYLSSEVNRFDDFARDTTRYSGEPVIIGFYQPLFDYNWAKWSKKINPIQYEMSKRDYIEDLERISRNATQRFFDLLLDQINYQIAETNVANTDTIYKIAEGRFELGKIAEHELLQLELTLMSAQQNLAEAEQDMETSQLRLKSYLGIKSDKKLALKLPSDIPQFEVDRELALEQALDNREDALRFKLRTIDAERDVERARGNSGLDADLRATYGISNRSGNFPGLYTNTDNQQSLRIDFSIPILDWGQTKARIKTQQANQKLTQYSVEQDKIDFEQEVYTHVNRFDMLRDQIKITAKSDTISQKRYEISKKRYLIGKISITDLNIALRDKDGAKRDYIRSLRDFWTAYYRLRYLTLYDFARDEQITVDEERNL